MTTIRHHTFTNQTKTGQCAMCGLWMEKIAYTYLRNIIDANCAAYLVSEGKAQLENRMDWVGDLQYLYRLMDYRVDKRTECVV